MFIFLNYFINCIVIVLHTFTIGHVPLSLYYIYILVLNVYTI